MVKKVAPVKQPSHNVKSLFGFMALRRMKQRLGNFIFLCFPLSRHLFNHLRWEVNAFLVQTNNKLNPLSIYRIYKIRAGNNLSVNIACGGNARKGWVNLDLMKHRAVILRYDCRKKLPFREATVARILCEHFLEHLDYYEEAPLLLKSCYKSLKKGGVLRLAVPDAGRFLGAYQSQNKQDWLALGWNIANWLPGFYTQMDVINFIFRQGEEHYYAYDLETLTLLLKRAGFENIQKTEYNTSQDPQFIGEQEEERFGILYVEVVK